MTHRRTGTITQIHTHAALLIRIQNTSFVSLTYKLPHHRKEIKVISCKKVSVAKERDKVWTRDVEQVVSPVDNDAQVVNHHDQTERLEVNH